jgi:epoxyqueuosine reductase
MSLKSSNEIKAEAIRLGFFACGVTRIKAVDADTALYFEKWLKAGHHASMYYLSNHKEIRYNPELLMPGAKSLVCLALNYTPVLRLPEREYQIAFYAYGKDYHDVMRTKLYQLAKAIGARQFRVCCDTAPILERYWATRAGIGFIGKNRQLIIPGAGSQFFLGELLLDEELEYDTPSQQSCHNCGKCIEACPTKALCEGGFDANRCLSYHTIENRGEIPKEIALKMGTTLFGCDECQKACPYNKNSIPTKEPSFCLSEELLSMTKAKWKALSLEDYRRLFKGSAVKRVKYEGLMRNISLLDGPE